MSLCFYFQGVFDGVTGIVRKPVEGAKQEGVSGFFKGDIPLLPSFISVLYLTDFTGKIC